MINCSFTKQKVRKIVVKGCYLHRQGISLSADEKTRIYFVIVCQNSHTLVREFYFFTKSVIENEKREDLCYIKISTNRNLTEVSSNKPLKITAKKYLSSDTLPKSALKTRSCRTHAFFCKNSVYPCYLLDSFESFFYCIIYSMMV